ncbi:unnamed protein product, partial [Mesorhabditis spiculigera]
MIRSGRRKCVQIIGISSVICAFFFLITVIWEQSDEIRANQPLETYVSPGKATFQVVVTGADGDRDSRTKEYKAPAGQASIASDKKVCNVPKLDINGAEVRHFFHPSGSLRCTGKPKNWAFINKAGRFSLVSSRAGAECKIQPFYRVNDDKLRYDEWRDIRSGDTLPTDFVKAKCTLGNDAWEGLLMSVVRNEEAVQRAKERSQPDDWSGLDVYFVSLDSVSQMTFRRKLPKTVAYFEKILGGVVLDAYNIVGDGTPQAFIPILTAQTEEELPLTRQGFLKTFQRYLGNVSATRPKDAANIGTFTYRLKGFKDQPTDHLTRTYFQEHEKFYGVTTCAGSSPIATSWYRYSEEFMKTYKDLPRFSLMHLSMYSHDDINQVGTLDTLIEGHLKEMHENGLFDRALIIMMADHGHRFAELRGTHQGQLEERLPFFSFAMPKSYREGKMKKAWENLVNNKDILSTPFDIHATLMDVLHMPSESELTTVQDASQRSLSLFRPLPIGRSCAQAGVDNHWCTCLNWEDATTTTKDKELTQQMAVAVVDVINAQTEPERKLCAPLRLKNLMYARRMVPNEAMLKYKAVKDADGFVPDLSGTTKADLLFYQLKLRTTPGDAEYEVTLRHEVSSDKLFVDLQSISHPNAFGDRPHCIIDKNYFLATYCVCYDRV